MKVVKRRRLKKGYKVLFLFLLAVLLVLYFKPKEIETKKTVIKKEEKVKESKKEYDLSLVMIGDALIHSTVYEDALKEDGSYDFKPMLKEIKPLVKDYDLKYYNQETILGGSELGLSNYPQFNSPYEVGDAFVDAGFNLVSLATNHTMDKREQGVLNSLAYWKKQKKVVTAGSYSSFEERDQKRIYEKNGIRYAFFSYTTWNNGLTPPAGKEYLNNEYNEELVKNDIERVRDEVDVILVAMHWGTEYSLDVSSEQQQIASYLASLGVDIIIGCHPHVIEPIEYIGKTLVIYSLGNFISDQVGIDRKTGLMASVTIHKEEEEGKKEITLKDLKTELLYTYSNNYKKRNFVVYPYTQLTEELLPNYRSYYERYKQVLQSRNQEIPVKGWEE